MQERDPRQDKIRAQERAATAQRQFDAARASASRESREMADVSGLNQAKREVKTGVEQLKSEIRGLHDDFVTWDSARERRMYARLDAADAKLREWKARADAADAEDEIQFRDDVARLEERTALTRARLAEWNSARHTRQAQEELEDAARHFDEAFDAAERRYK